MLYLVKPCKTSAAYEAIPDKDLCFDIDESADRLKQDYDIVANVKIMLVVKGACEISICPRSEICESCNPYGISTHRSGKLIIKTDSEEKAKDAADKIYELLR